MHAKFEHDKKKTTVTDTHQPMLEEEVHDTSSEASEVFTNQPNAFVRGVRSIFGYRKTSLTLFVILTIVVTAGLSFYDNSLELTIELPTSQLEKEILESSWMDQVHD